MGRVTKATGHLSEREIRERMKEAKSNTVVRKWLAILHALVDPSPAVEIAAHTGFAKGTIHNLISDYNRYGPDVVEGPGRGGRRNAHMSREAEGDFLAPFFDMAKRGHIVIGAQIGRALEEHLGCQLHHSVVYRFLERNQWRKVVPRPAHIQSRQQVQQEFKKNSPKR
jgi:transposase